MFAGKQPEVDPLEVAKATLKRKGWSYRKGSPHLGVGWQHLAKVLTGRRVSASLLRRIEEMPDNPERNPGPRDDS